MQVKTVHQAKTILSNLIKKAQSGEDVIICKSGKPAVRIVKYEPANKVRMAGIWKGKVKIAPDFDVLPDSFLKAFKNGNDK